MTTFRKMKLVYIYADNEKEWNCSEWLCAMRMRAMLAAGHSAEMFSVAEFVGQPTKCHLACESADIIFVERNLSGPVLNEILNWRLLFGKPVVALFDDANHLLPTTNVVYKHWIGGYINHLDGGLEVADPKPIDQFALGLHICSAFITPSEKLLDRWGAYTKGYFLPNHLELPRYQGIEVVPHPGEIWIGWGGSVSHFESVENAGVIAGLKRVCARHPEVKMIVQTSDPRVLKSMRDIPEKQRIYRKWVKYDKWPQQLAQWDISLAVVKGEYDAHRSLIHLEEPLALDKPVTTIASDSAPYNNVKGVAVMAANTVRDWEAAIEEVVSHLDKYREWSAGYPHQWALGYDIAQHVPMMEKIYQEIIDHERSLNQDL